MSRRRDSEELGFHRRPYGASTSYLSQPRALARSKLVFPFSRSRVHPVLLVPVFLFGLAFSRFSAPPLPNPVYRGDLYTDQDRDGDAYQPFLPPDAPPLNPFEEEDLRRAASRNGDGRPRAGRGTGGDDGEWDSDVDPDESTARPAHLTALDGYLYFPPSAPLVHIKIPKSSVSHRSSTPFDSLLVLPPRLPRPATPKLGVPAIAGPPPPAVLDWVHPGAPFNPPISPARVAALPVQVPPNPGERRPAPPARPALVAPVPGSRRLGANAEAMRRANLEGRPFRPVKPADMLQDQRMADVAERRRVAVAIAEAAELEHQRKIRLQLPPVFAPGGGARVQPLPGAQVRPDPMGGGARPGVPKPLPPAGQVPPRVQAADLDEEDREPTAEEMALEDAELLEIFESLTDQERSLLTPDELAVFLELENEMDRKKVRLDVDDDNAPLRNIVKRAVIPDEEPIPASDLERPEAAAQVAAEGGTNQESSTTLHRRAEPAAPSAKNRVHPIAYLVQEAEEKWNALLERQSQTLFQAVVEYQRRYGRKPPLGFDAWWRYAMQNRVVLVDEYDQIDEDISPFFSLPASEIRARANQLATNARLPHHADTFTIQVRDGAITASGPNRRTQRAEDTQDLMGEFAESLPDMSLTFTSHELPMVAISGEAKIRHEHYARNHHLLDTTQRNEILENTAYQPWQGLCRPNSTSRRVANGQSTGRPHGPSFVSTEHFSAMDICLHPENQNLNGFTSWAGPRPYLLYPLFSWAKTSMHGDILSAPIDTFSAPTATPTPWEKKAHNKVMWRGPTTGMYAQRGSTWRTSQRSRLVLLTSDREGEREVLFADPKENEALRRFVGPTADINAFYYDVGFSGTPVQCDTTDQTCELMAHELRFLPKANAQYASLFKYVLDVDSNGASPDFHRLLQSGSVVFKSTIFPEWFTRRIMPWFHYVPIKSDYADLTDVSAFFIGAPDGSGSHDALAEKIAENGKKWAEEHWREADMAAYQFRLYLEYSRLISREDEGSHDFVLDT